MILFLTLLFYGITLFFLYFFFRIWLFFSCRLLLLFDFILTIFDLSIFLRALRNIRFIIRCLIYIILNRLLIYILNLLTRRLSIGFSIFILLDMLIVIDLFYLNEILNSFGLNSNLYWQLLKTL